MYCFSPGNLPNDLHSGVTVGIQERAYDIDETNINSVGATESHGGMVEESKQPAICPCGSNKPPIIKHKNCEHVICYNCWKYDVSCVQCESSLLSGNVE